MTTYIYTYIHAYIQSIQKYINKYVHTYIYTYIHTYIHTYIVYMHTYIHAYMEMGSITSRYVFLSGSKSFGRMAWRGRATAPSSYSSTKQTG